MTPAAESRQAELDSILSRVGSIVVAFSGGVDSSYLACRAGALLGKRALAVTAVSPSLATVQKEMARRVAGLFSLEHRFVETSEMEDPLYARNEGDRCYRCKTELFGVLLPLARAEGFAGVAYGLVTDDLTDYRPGHRAALEAGVLSPLAEAGLTKDDVRALSKEMGLPTWDLPASPCLASRLPYGTRVTPEALLKVERAEEALRSLGFREFRVRHLGPRARLEIAPAEMPLSPSLERAALAAVLSAGYEEAAVDPAGYRRGRLNEELRILR